MRLGHFDLNLLIALEALLDTRSVTKAGERLCIGQSSMSGNLARLRAHFGDELMVQVGRKMELTPVAAGLLQPVREALRHIESAVTPPQRFDPISTQRRFIISATDYATTVLLTPVMRRLRTEAPGVSLQVMDVGEHAFDRLDRGELDFVICAEPYASPLHPREVLFEEECACLVDANNPVKGKQLSRSDFERLGHVVAQVGTTRTALHERWFLENTSIKRKVEVIVSNFNLMPQFVLGTDRVATMHGSLARWYAEHLPMRLLKPPMAFPTLQIMAQWHRSTAQDPAHLWMREVLREGSKA